MLGASYSEYRLLLVLVAVVLAVGLALVLNATRLGLVTRAVIMNEDLARGLGINSGLVRFVTFSLGAGLASLAGALITPLSSVDPNMGVPWLVNAFMLVMVSGVSLLSLARRLPGAGRRAGAGQLVGQSDPRRPDHRRAGRAGAAPAPARIQPWLTAQVAAVAGQLPRTRATRCARDLRTLGHLGRRRAGC